MLYASRLGRAVDGPYKLSASGLALIKASETCDLNAYWDVNGYSIGWGHHSDSINGSTVWSQDQADNQLELDAQTATEWVISKLSTIAKERLTQGRLDALTDFVYNDGDGNFVNSTLLRLINIGDDDSVPSEFSKWVYITTPKGKKISKALQLRRQREISLWETGQWN